MYLEPKKKRCSIDQLLFIYSNYLLGNSTFVLVWAKEVGYVGLDFNLNKNGPFKNLFFECLSI